MSDLSLMVPCDYCQYGSVRTEYGEDQCPKCSSTLARPATVEDLRSLLITDEMVENGFEYLRRVGWTISHDAVRGLLEAVVSELTEET